VFETAAQFETTALITALSDPLSRLPPTHVGNNDPRRHIVRRNEGCPAGVDAARVWSAKITDCDSLAQAELLGKLGILDRIYAA
jgi:hypothetical protein